MFGLAVLNQTFQRRESWLSAAVNAAKTAWPARPKFWAATCGNNIPGPELILSEELARRSRSKGSKFPITGGVRGDAPGNSFVYIPSLKAVVAGDTVLDRVYFGVPKPGKYRDDWVKTLNQIKNLKQAIVILGHEGPGARHDLSAIAFMKKYMAD
jgi:hypothetical protein